MTAEQLAVALGVGPARLRLLFYVLVVAGLLIEQDGRFSNTDKANQFLVKGEPSYMGNRHAAMAAWWRENFKPPTPSVAASQRQSWIFPTLHPRNWRHSSANLNASTVPSARASGSRFLVCWRAKRKEHSAVDGKTQAHIITIET